MKKRAEISKANLKFRILIVIILMVIFAYFVMKILGYDPRAQVEEIAVTKYGALAFIGLFVISAFFPLPMLTFLGAAIFSFEKVFAYSIIGNMVNATIVFFVVRFFGREYVQIFESKHEKVKKIDAEFEKHGFRDIILLRFFFLIPPEIVNLSGGLSRMKFGKYFLASLIGNIPVSIASIMLIQGKMNDNYTMISISVAMFILMFIIPLFYVAGIRAFSHQKYKEAKKFIQKNIQ